MPFPGGQTTPDAFARFLASLITPEVANAVGEKVKAALREVPEKLYSVMRQSPTGPVPQQSTFASLMAELTDELKIDNELKRYQIQQTNALIFELQENRKLGDEMMRSNGRRKKKDEE